ARHPGANIGKRLDEPLLPQEIERRRDIPRGRRHTDTWNVGSERWDKRRDALARFANLVEPGCAQGPDRRREGRQSQSGLHRSPAGGVAILLALVIEGLMRMRSE